jgi:hypothetical protein
MSSERTICNSLSFDKLTQGATLVK